MKQTATEWLFEKLWETPKDKLTWNALLEQAKEMGKKQITDAWNDGLFGELRKGDDNAQQYYNETYGK